MNEAALAALGVIVAALIAGVVTIITTLLTRSARNQPATPAPTAPPVASPEPPADADQSEIVEWLWGQMRRLLREEGEAKAELTRLRREVAGFRRLIARLIRPIVEWLDAGHEPPPPDVPPELRALIAELERDPGPLGT